MAEKNLKGLFLHTVKDVYYAEHEILKALPKMAGAAQHKELKAAFEKHRGQTEQQIRRLDQVFRLVGERAEGVPCEAIQGILKEGQGATIDARRRRLPPGEMADRPIADARGSGGGAFGRNRAGTVRGRPVPVALLGAGIAWLMLAGWRSRRRRRG